MKHACRSVAVEPECGSVRGSSSRTGVDAAESAYQRLSLTRLSRGPWLQYLPYLTYPTTSATATATATDTAPLVRSRYELVVHYCLSLR